MSFVTNPSRIFPDQPNPMSFLTNMFKPKTPDMPAPVAPPPPPTIQDAAVQAQQSSDEQRKRMGRAATQLTGATGQGTGGPATTATKQLLGG